MTVFDEGLYHHVFDGQLSLCSRNTFLKCVKCYKNLYEYVHDCVNCDVTIELNVAFHEDNLDVDIERLRMLHNRTPSDQMITKKFMNSHISDSELKVLVDDYYEDYQPLTPDFNDIDDPSDEDLFMKYNGYF